MKLKNFLVVLCLQDHIHSPIIVVTESVKAPYQILKAVQRTAECCLAFKRVLMCRALRVQVSGREKVQLSALANFTSITVEELTCLAAWKDGNARYLVGLVSHNHATSNEERFRCFVYEKLNSNVGKYGM